jgi:hypothetical protein
MPAWKPIPEPARPRAHLILGIWNTRALRIDGQSITAAMVKARMRRDGWYAPESFAEVQRFAWGAVATPKELQLLAYGCCEFAVPAQWVQAVTSRFALEQWFIAQLRQLPCADFALYYGERELYRLIRRRKRRQALDRS